MVFPPKAKMILLLVHLTWKRVFDQKKKTRKAKTRQDKTRQNKTRQDKTKADLFKTPLAPLVPPSVLASGAALAAPAVGG